MTMSDDLSRCPKCGGPADNGHDRSIPPNPYFCTRCMEDCPHGVADGNCKECYGEATNSEPFTVFTTLRQREWPALWTGCPNCASLQDQNTELDRKLAEMEQTSLELCETCGWRTLIPGDCCLNCVRQQPKA